MQTPAGDATWTEKEWVLWEWLTQWRRTAHAGPSIHLRSNHVSLSDRSPQPFPAKSAPETMLVSSSKTVPIWFIPWEFGLHGCQKVIFKEVCKLPHSGGLSPQEQMEQRKLQGRRGRKAKSRHLLRGSKDGGMQWLVFLNSLRFLITAWLRSQLPRLPLNYESIVVINFLFLVQLIWRGFAGCYPCSLHWTTSSSCSLADLKCREPSQYASLSQPHCEY